MKHVFSLFVVFMSMLMLSACGSDEKNQNVDSDQSSDVDLSTDEMAVTEDAFVTEGKEQDVDGDQSSDTEWLTDESVVTEDELVDNGDTDVDELLDEDLVAKYNMTYVGNELSFTLPEGEWAYETCSFATIAEVYYNGALIGVVEYEDPDRNYPYPEESPGCDIVGCVEGKWDQKFKIIFKQNYSTLIVKFLFGVGKIGGYSCSEKEPVTVTLTNQ